MYGHWHDLQHMSATHKDGPIGAWSIGCLKDMSDEELVAYGEDYLHTTMRYRSNKPFFIDKIV